MPTTYFDDVSHRRRPHTATTIRLPSIDVVGADKRGTPGWWAARLIAQVEHQSRQANAWWDWYEGLHPLPWLSEAELVEQFMELQRIARTNFTGLVVDAVEERLNIKGFRVGADAPIGDAEIWDIWNRNEMDAGSRCAHLASFVTSRAYSMVWIDDNDRVRTSVEDGFNVAVQPDGLEVAAAVKVWHDEIAGLDRVELHLLDGLYRFARAESATGLAGGKYEPDTDAKAGEFTPLPDRFRAWRRDGVVPITPIAVRPGRRIGTWRNELDDAVDVQARINQTVFDRLVGQQYSSFQQVVATGVEMVEDANGQPINPFKHTPGRAWAVPEPDAKIVTIPPADVAPILAAVEADVTMLANITKTPPYYLDAKGRYPSGDAIKGADAGLVRKAQRRASVAETGWTRTARHMLAALGRATDADLGAVEVIWGDFEVRTEGELVDGLLKMNTLGVPKEKLWERWGASQIEIAQWRQRSDEDALLEFARGIPDAPAATSQPATLNAGG